MNNWINCGDVVITPLTIAIHLFQQYQEKASNVPDILAHELFSDVIVIKHESPGKFTKSKEEYDQKLVNKSSMGKPFVIVGSQCGAAILRGANIFAPGVLGYPYGVVPGETRLDVYVDVTNKTLQGTVTGTINNSTYFSNSDNSDLSHYIFLGEGISMMTRRELFRPPDQDVNYPMNDTVADYKQSQGSKTSVRGIAVKMVECIFDCPSINGDYLNSLCFLQNLPSIVVGHSLMYGKATGTEDERILDMCAAPGGKTTHIASILSNRGQGTVFALDKSQNKIDSINRNLKRFELENYAKALVRDSTKLLSKNSDVINDQIFSAAMFDRILLDAPCSALGQRPQFNVSMKPKELKSFPKIQRKLFSVACELLKPGGVLVYSTCTFTIEENEEIIMWAIDNFADKLTVEDLFSERFSNSQNSLIIGDFQKLSNLGNPGVVLQNCEKYQKDLTKTRRFGIPLSEQNEDNDTIGFFIAKFRKSY